MTMRQQRRLKRQKIKNNTQYRNTRKEVLTTLVSLLSSLQHKK